MCDYFFVFVKGMWLIFGVLVSCGEWVIFECGIEGGGIYFVFLVV